MRVEAIEDSLVGDELVKKFQQLYEETFKERFEYTANYLSIASGILSTYLVSLALTGNYETISKLLEKHLWVLNTNEQVSVLTRLMLNALLGSKDRKDQLGSELKDRLSVKLWELIKAFRSDMYSEFLFMLMVIFGAIKLEDGIAKCMSLDDLTEKTVCMHAISVAMNDNDAVELLRRLSIIMFQESLSKSSSLLKGLGVNVDKLLNMLDEFMGLVYGLDGKSLVQLIAPRGSMARLALMLYALVNGDGRLARAHALYGAVDFGEKLPTRLFLEAYRECCDLGSEEFRHAIARLFFYHI